MPNNISNTYKRKTIRLKDYNYSQAGLYYVTICCYDKQHLFGEIENNKMILNKCGEIVHECWINIPTHYPNAKLHEYVIMPDHIHGIIELLDDTVGANQYSPITAKQYSPEIAKNISSIPRSPSKTIGSVIRGFKIGVTKWIRQNTNIYDVWQRNYYEHIIRNQHSYEQITQYIIDNPANWEMGDGTKHNF